MKKILAIVFVITISLSVFTACGVNVEESYDTLVNYIVENGTKEDDTYFITYKRMDLNSLWDEDDGSITIRVDESKTLFFESVYPDHATSITYIKGQDLCEVVDIYNHSTDMKISTGKISIKSFSTANKTVQSFQSNTYADYKELLGGNADLLIRDVKIVLKEINIGITVAELGFEKYDY